MRNLLRRGGRCPKTDNPHFCSPSYLHCLYHPYPTIDFVAKPSPHRPENKAVNTYLQMAESYGFEQGFEVVHTRLRTPGEIVVTKVLSRWEQLAAATERVPDKYGSLGTHSYCYTPHSLNLILIITFALWKNFADKKTCTQHCARLVCGVPPSTVYRQPS